MHRIVMFLFATSILFNACGDEASSPDATPAIADAAVNLADAAVNLVDATQANVCFPEGIYGSCTLGCSNCLNGANIYSVCSSSCTDSSDCGLAADFNGASPLCAPLNPGDVNMICVLTCTSPDECPCGLECRESGVQGIKIFAETL